MEKRLTEEKELVSYFLPSASGGDPKLRGRITEVEHLVDVRLEQFEMTYTASGVLPAGDAKTVADFAAAETAFMAGQTALTGGDVREAYRKFAEAYQKIANTGP